MAGALQQLGEAAELLGDLAGDAGGAAGGIERERIGPDELEGFADDGLREVGEEDAVGGRVREVDVGAAGAGEFRVELDGVADIDDEEEGRPAFARREGAGVLLSLAVGLEHGVIPRGGAADGGPFLRALFFGLRHRGERGGFLLLLDALLGLEDEAAALVEIDAAGAGGAVLMMKGDAALEDVGVVGVVGVRGVRARDAEEIAQLGEKEGVVGALGGAGALPASDEVLNGGLVHGADGSTAGVRGVSLKVAWVAGDPGYSSTSRQ